MKMKMKQIVTKKLANCVHSANFCAQIISVLQNRGDAMVHKIVQTMKMAVVRHNFRELNNHKVKTHLYYLE